MSQYREKWEPHLQCVAKSDVGMRRTNNQDSHAIVLANDLEDWQKFGHLFVVADGMGAHAAGELASKLATDHVPHLYRKYTDLSAPESLKRAVVETNAEINRRGQANEEFHHMGTTCSAMLMLPHGVVVAHVGDSRVYRLRNDQLEQLTFDHSLVWEMRASGQLSKESELAEVVPKNVITRSLGPYPEVKVDLEGPFEILPGDRYLLCSDGLTGEVSDEELGAILANMPPNEAVQALVDLANLRGGPDNITAVAVKVIDGTLATHHAETQPLTIGRDPQARSVHPVSWAFLAAAILSAGVMAMLQQWAMCAAAGVLAVLTLVYVLVRYFNGRHLGTVVPAGRRFGKGPHARADCSVGNGLLEKFERLVGDLRKAAEEERWKVDWSKINAFAQEAATATEQGEPAAAVRAHMRSVSFIMQQLRSHNGS